MKVSIEADKMISSTLNFKKWDAALMKSMGKTKNYVKNDGYY